MKLKYVGPFEAVDVPALGLVDVKRGTPVEATGAVAESLLEQDAWERVAERKPAAKKTAAKRTTAKKTAAKKPAPPADPTSTEE